MTQLGDILLGAGMVGIGAGQAAQEHDAFGGSTLVVAGLLALLSAQEAEKAAAWRIADIEAMRSLLGDAAPIIEGGWTLTELDVAWATLSEALIIHHAAVELKGDKRQDGAICAFYRESTQRRELIFPL